MPTVPLVDLDKLDLDEVVVTKEELYGRLKQAGRLALVDGVLLLDTGGDLVVGYKDIRADDWWASDHIPGRPLFPGTLMVEASAQLSTYDFLQRRPELENAFIGFIGIDDTRFRATVEPPSRLVFVCRIARIRTTMFTYVVQGVVGDEVVFDARITGMVV